MDPKKFYLGRVFDPTQGKLTQQSLLYDPDDLNTHAIVVGMTGSGKTGLCVTLLEEAALHNIPALMIDPKGDITNVLLHFPDLAPQDFQPWLDPDQARRADKTMEVFAAETAERWRTGLTDWGIDLNLIRTLKDSAHFAVYTPGSDAGIPISILASLKAPSIPWEENRELLREKISSTVTALLGLVGMDDVDPVRSREHILLSNIFEYAWSQGYDLDLGELIMQTQKPPFSRLGVFDINTFFPEKDRFNLAMLLNNILAAPAFQAWIEGQPLDIPTLLYHPDGRPRHSVFYLAHLSDAERMFFITLLYSTVESWMRAQAGTNSLRAIIYFDEIFGYLPPVRNPPSKQVMLRLLKQARAFGVSQVLVTQNPVDLDYKALSNTGTWLIGKLQTEQDKERLLDGLQGATGEIDRDVYNRLISALAKRVFLLHNIHRSDGPGNQPLLFQTRWAINYLAGPLTRTQIPALNQLAGAVLSKKSTPEPATPASASPTLTPRTVPATTAGQVASSTAQTAALPGAQPAIIKSTWQSGTEQPTSTRQLVPMGITEYFLPNNLKFSQAFRVSGQSYREDAISQGLVYRPCLLAQASVRFLNRKFNLDYETRLAVLVTHADPRGVIHWEDYSTAPFDAPRLNDQPALRALFGPLEAPLSQEKLLKALEKDFLDWVYRTSQISLRVNETLKIYAGPTVTPADFRRQSSAAARQRRDQEIVEVTEVYEHRLATLREKLAREERELTGDETEFSQRRREELGTHAENIFGLFGGRRSRKLSTSLAKHRLTAQAKSDVKEKQAAIADLQKQISDLEQEKAQAIEQVNTRWGDIASQDSQMVLTPLKKDVLRDLFGVAWFPYYIVKTGADTFELPAFSQ